MKSLIVIPTYNEKENIEKLVHEILELKQGFDILIIDDNSPDGTGRMADVLASRHPEVSVIHRPARLGLGTAYVTGFKHALRNGYDFILTMDADFSHHPVYLRSLLEEARKHDLVIGSRYIRGGEINNWSLPRVILSKAANIYVRLVTGIPVFDTTGGFNCYRREILHQIDLDKIVSEGYAFQIEMKYKIWRKGFSIKEIPITFNDRTRGRSKISRKIIFQAFFLVWKLLFHPTQ